MTIREIKAMRLANQFLATPGKKLEAVRAAYQKAAKDVERKAELKEDYRKKRTAAAAPKASPQDGMIDISEEEISEIAKAVLARLG